MILDELVTATRRRVADAKRRVPDGALREQLVDLPDPLDFCNALDEPGVSLIAEVKRASPSRGLLVESIQVGALAAAYAEAGADALSVLTEPSRFLGSLADLRDVRDTLEAKALRRPLLRKDFIIDAYQLVEARLHGADAVLLIAAALDDAALVRLYGEAVSLQLTPLVEVHNEDELRRALALSPVAVGINNRNLATFAVDLETTARLCSQIPDECLVVSESGIHTPDQVRRLAGLGVDAVLVGEALVTASDPARMVRVLKEAGR